MDEVVFIKMDIAGGTGLTAARVKSIIAQIDATIDAFLVKGLEAVANGDKVMYELDTGQTKTKVQYTDPTAIYKAIDNLTSLRRRYQNMLTPRRVRLVDGKSFNKR